MKIFLKVVSDLSPIKTFLEPFSHKKLFALISKNKINHSRYEAAVVFMM
jgi:hypothetical protein